MKSSFVFCAVALLVVGAVTACSPPGVSYQRVVVSLYDSSGCAYLISWDAHDADTPGGTLPTASVKALPTSDLAFETSTQRFPENDKPTCTVKPTPPL